MVVTKALVFFVTATILRATIDPPAIPITAVAAELGITSQIVAAAGLQDQSLAILQRLADADELRDSFAQQRGTLATASATFVAASDALMHQPDDEAVRNQYALATEQGQAAETALESTRQQLVQIVTQGLTSAQVQKLANWCDSEGRRTPAALRIKHRTDDQWKSLEIALIAEQRALATGEQLQSTFSAVLFDARSDPEVVEAAANLQAHLAAVQAVFDQFASNPPQ